MSTKIKLIVGLNNPGAQYQYTRHNAGGWAVQALADSEGIRLSPQSKYSGLVGKGKIAGQEVYLLLPTTFMNLSGQAVGALANFFQIQPDEILVAHDELDLPPGTAKFKTGGGHGGQNGLRDIISKLGNQQGFHRLRIGIGHPGDKTLVTGHVLGKPSAHEQKLIETAIAEALAVLPGYIGGEAEKAMNRLHSFKG
ncbi:MAG: hypothetical protein RL217_71 [Pseudomonadota bacterium]|jgi:PTH1 family peptidyl-tRNA hydrolase